MNKKNTVNLAGLLQEALAKGVEAFEELICKWAKECFIDYCNRLGSKASGAKYAHYQDCLNDKIRDDAYDKNNRYPEGNVGNEVSFEKVDGKWQSVMSKNKKGAYSNRWTPKDGRRLDVTLSEGGKIKTLYDVKFPNDKFTPEQLDDYKDIAKDLKGKFEEFNVKQKCTDWPNECPNKKPVKESVPAPVKEPAKETMNQNATNWRLVGGLVVVAVAVTICPFDGPAGDVVAWGAVAAAF